MNDPTQPTPDQPNSLADATDTWIAVVRAYNECTATLSQNLEPFGVTLLQHEILMNLAREPGLTQQHLSDRCFSAKSGISMIVARFVKDGLVERKRAPKDHRAWSLSLTASGDALAAKTKAVQDDVVREMAKALTPNELALVGDRMDQASALLREMRSGNDALAHKG